MGVPARHEVEFLTTVGTGKRDDKNPGCPHPGFVLFGALPCGVVKTSLVMTMISNSQSGKAGRMFRTVRVW